MTTIASEIRDFFSDPKVVAEIISELNTEIKTCPIIRNIQRERDCGVIDNESITFGELGSEDRNEVFVYLGRILESLITCKLASARRWVIKKDRNSSGDLTIEWLDDMQQVEHNDSYIWEIKGTSSDDCWTGSTHATKKEDEKMDFIGVKYGMNDDANVFDLIDGKVDLLNSIFIGVFEQIRLIRIGKATDSSSRTSLRIGIDQYESFKNQVSWGNLAYPKGGIYKKNGQLKKNVKYLRFCAA